MYYARLERRVPDTVTTPVDLTPEKRRSWPTTFDEGIIIKSELSWRLPNECRGALPCPSIIILMHSSTLPPFYWYSTTQDPRARISSALRSLSVFSKDPLRIHPKIESRNHPQLGRSRWEKTLLVIKRGTTVFLKDGASPGERGLHVLEGDRWLQHWLLSLLMIQIFVDRRLLLVKCQCIRMDVNIHVLFQALIVWYCLVLSGIAWYYLVL